IPYIKIPIADIMAYLGSFSYETKGKIFQAVLDFGLYQEWANLELSEREQIGYSNVKEIVENEIKSYKKFCREQKQKIKNHWDKIKNYDDTNVLPLRNNQAETKTEAELKNIKKLTKKSEPGVKSPKPDFFEDFWQVYPKQRVGNKDKARAAFFAAISRTNTPAEQIIAKAEEYANSDEVARGFAKGAQAWLNDDRYLRNYIPTPPSGNTLQDARKAGMQVINEMFGGKK
ncbi:MAG: hypothetical protein J5601_04105, partial [Elusimicrobiaceae bacterium]|nr:hypothetical protein [Elusimicrobiaceae bacterium]